MPATVCSLQPSTPAPKGQHDLRLIGPVRGIDRAPVWQVALCKTSGQAVGLAILLSGKSNAQVADELGMERAQLSRIVHGTHHMPADRALRFAQVTHSWAWQQWVALQAGFDLVTRQETPEERVSRLEAEVVALRAAAA